MNNKEITALLREAESRDNLAVALKGGKAAAEFRKEREALEKVAGGKKKLAEVDKVLADARTKAGQAITAGEAEGVRLTRAAAGDILARRAALNDREAGLDTQKVNLSARKDDLDARQLRLDGGLDELVTRAATADERDGTLNGRETAVAARESRATAREAEIKRFDDWRAAAPA